MEKFKNLRVFFVCLFVCLAQGTLQNFVIFKFSIYPVALLYKWVPLAYQGELFEQFSLLAYRNG